MPRTKEQSRIYMRKRYRAKQAKVGKRIRSYVKSHVSYREDAEPSLVPIYAPIYTSITAFLMGDPPIGRSALDRRHQ